MKKGQTYRIKKTIANRHGIHQEVICANDVGSSGFYCLALLKNPKDLDEKMKPILHKFLPLKFKHLL